jgi:hypothetical protein
MPAMHVLILQLEPHHACLRLLVVLVLIAVFVRCLLHLKRSGGNQDAVVCRQQQDTHVCTPALLVQQYQWQQLSSLCWHPHTCIGGRHKLIQAAASVKRPVASPGGAASTLSEAEGKKVALQDQRDDEQRNKKHRRSNKTRHMAVQMGLKRIVAGE